MKTGAYFSLLAPPSRLAKGGAPQQRIEGQDARQRSANASISARVWVKKSAPPREAALIAS